MKADFAIFGGAAACLLLIPLAVLLWSGKPLGTAESLLMPKESAPLVLPGDDTPAEDTGEKQPDTTEAIDSFHILNSSTGIVEEVALLDYVTGAIASEMPASYNMDALIAQGIASYTDGVYLAGLRRSAPEEGLKGADFSADPQNKAGYLTEKEMRDCWGESYDTYYSRVRKAAETAVQYQLTYEGEPILAAYFAISAGSTTEDSGNVWSASLAYLSPVDSSWDREADGFESSVTLTKAELRELLIAKGAVLESDSSQWLQILQRSEAGYVTSLCAGSLTMTGQEFRTLCGLRSSCFTFSWDKAGVTFNVKGYGHGVGLSQSGANYLAGEGKSFSDILLHYYPGTELTPLATDFTLD